MTAFDNVINLNGKRYKVVTPPPEQSITQFPAKELIGHEPNQGDHNLTGTLALGDFSGGWGRYRYEAGGDVDKFWYSTLDTRWPGRLLTLPTLVTGGIGLTAPSSYAEGGWATCVESTGGETRPLHYSDAIFTVPNSNFTRTGFTGTAWTSAPLITRTLAGGGIVYITDSIHFQDGQLFACADTTRTPIAYRYCASDITAAVTTSTSVPLAMKFATLGESVYMAGQKVGDTATIYLSTSSAPYSSTTWTDVMSFKRDDKAKDICFFVQGWTAQGRACFFLGTSKSIFEIDATTWIAQKIFTFPSPYKSSDVDTQISACIWEKDGNLYVSQGFNLWQFDGSGYQNVSPFSVGDGLPGGTGAAYVSDFDFTTSIIDIFSRRGELCCVTRGAAAGKSCAVLVWRNNTWHTLMLSGFTDVGGGVSFTPRYGKGMALGDAVFVRGGPAAGSSSTSVCGVWDQDVGQPPYVRRSADLSSSFSGGVVYAPRFNGNFPVDAKLALSSVLYGGPADVRVRHRIDNDTTDYDFGAASVTTLTANGQTSDLTVASGVGRSFKETGVAISLGPASAGTGLAMLDSVGIKYLLTPRTLWGWRPEIDLSQTFESRSPAAMRDELKALLDGGVLYPFYYGSEGTAAAPKYVRVSAEGLMGAMDDTGPSNTSSLHLTLLEPRPNAGFV